MEVETGRDSIRIDGKRIEELPFVASHHAQAGMPDFLATDRENQIRAIRARFPRPSVGYIDSRLRECRENIQRFLKMQAEETALISEYQGHIALCKHRDRMIAALHPDRDSARIKDLRREFPPYDVEAMTQQIRQSEESLDRLVEVVRQEQSSIIELHAARALCQQRDAELHRLGVQIE